MEEYDEFERILDFCIEKVYRSLKNEREQLWKKLIDRSFGDAISEIISELYIARADIRNAYRKEKIKMVK